MLIIITLSIASVQSQEQFTKIVLTDENKLFYPEGEYLMKKEGDTKSIFYVNIFVPTKWDKSAHPANYIIHDNKLVFIMPSKDDLFVHSRREYDWQHWRISLECADLDEVHYHPNRGIVFSDSPIGLNLGEYIAAYFSDSFYYDFIAHEGNALLFIKTGECNGVWDKDKNVNVDNTMLIFKNTASVCDNKWKLVNQFEMKEDRGIFITSKDDKGNILIHFQNGTTYQVDKNIKSLKRDDSYKRKNAILLTYGDSYFWLSEEEADALKQSDDPIGFLKVKINRK